MEMLPKRRAPVAKPLAATSVSASGGAMFVTFDGGGISRGK